MRFLLSFFLQFILLLVATMTTGLALERAITVSGQVRDQLQMVVPHARVVIKDIDSKRVVRGETGSNGRFLLTVDFARYVVELEDSDLQLQLDLSGPDTSVTVNETLNYQTPVASSTRMPVLLLDTPQSVSVVSREQMRDQSMQSLADVVRYVPGITMALGEGHRDAPVIRGNQTTADMYINGVRDDVQYYRDLYNLERVEAVKGANAMTFGRGGGGGVLNRVTKDANFMPLRELSLEGGSFGKKRLALDVSQSFKERYSFRLNGMFEDSNSYRRQVGLERYGVAPSFTWSASERTQVKVNYEHFSDGRTVDRGLPSFAGRPFAADWRTFFGDPKLSQSSALVNTGSIRVEHQMGRWNWRSTLLSADYDKFYQNVFSGAVSTDQTLVSLSGYNTGTLRRNWFGQSDISGQFSTGRIRHTLLAGTEFGHQRTGNIRQTAYFGSSTSILAPTSNPTVDSGALFRPSATDADNLARNRVGAAFVQDQIEVSRYLQFLVGVRYDFFGINVRNRRTLENTARNDNMIAPRLGVVVKPVANLSLYGSYSVAYLPSSGDQFGALTVSQQTIRPEKFNNYETGLKWDINRNLTLSAALYRLDRTNTTARDPNDPTRIVQTGTQRTNGYEMSLNGNLTRRWMMVGGYAVQDAFISSPTSAAVLGAKVALVPRHTISLWNHYRVTNRWSAGLGVIEQASLWAGIDNTVKLPGFTRVDLASYYSLTEKTRLQVNVENLMNTGYYPTAHSNTNILPGAPRSIRAGFQIRF